MALALTRGQIIAAGLDLAGRPDLTSQGRLWLNLFLERQYYNEDYAWLVKTGYTVPVANGSAAPTDYRSAKSCIIVNSANGTTAEVQIMDNWADYEYRSVTYGNQMGTAKYAYINRQLNQFFFLPNPTGTYVLNLDYFYIPSLPDYTDPSHDSDAPVWKLPLEILIDQIKNRAMEYSDDARQPQAKNDVSTALTEAKFNNNDKRAGSSRFPMGKRFRKRFF